METDRFERELDKNRLAYERLRDLIQREYSGKCVGMAFGRIVAADDDFDNVVAEVDALSPPPACSLVFFR